MQVDFSYKGRLYKIWANMKQRCSNPKATCYADYGGRGIEVCDEWHTFANFREWAIVSGYNDSLEIDRRDLQDHYRPQNCLWVSESSQAANRRKRRGTKHKFIGVRSIHGNKWRAVIDHKGQNTHLGVFDTEVAAAECRDEYIKSNGLPHKLNF